MKSVFTLILVSLCLSSSTFAACNQSVIQDPSITQTAALKLGHGVAVNGQLIGCSDGSNGFSDYVAAGECLSVPIFNAQKTPIGRLLITCEAQ